MKLLIALYITLNFKLKIELIEKNINVKNLP